MEQNYFNTPRGQNRIVESYRYIYGGRGKPFKTVGAMQKSEYMPQSLLYLFHEKMRKTAGYPRSSRAVYLSRFDLYEIFVRSSKFTNAAWSTEPSNHDFGP